MGNFITAMKTTIDYEASKLAAAAGVGVVDLTDDLNVEEFLASEESAILVELITLDVAPVEPMWDVLFAVGAKTSKDSGRLTQMGFLDAVKQDIKVGDSIPVHDYSGAVAGPKIGSLYVTRVSMDTAQGDRVAGLRMIVIQGKALAL